MRKEATFRTSAFNTSEVRDYFINEGCFGDDLAKWMIGRLREAGVETDDEPGQEDLAGTSSSRSRPVRTAASWDTRRTSQKACGISGWSAAAGCWDSILGRRGHGIDEAAVRALDAVLASAAEIRDLQWESR